ncbi:hypothetical protein DFS34DRAFT_35576 [Phlyctochytrium arcticum]|nr:hypothetical protein DFS34DRAFT_35576 [Phlyctochytrium arcticum]
MRTPRALPRVDAQNPTEQLSTPELNTSEARASLTTRSKSKTPSLFSKSSESLSSRISVRNEISRMNAAVNKSEERERARQSSNDSLESSSSLRRAVTIVARFVGPTTATLKASITSQQDAERILAQTLSNYKTVDNAVREVFIKYGNESRAEMRRRGEQDRRWALMAEAMARGEPGTAVPPSEEDLRRIDTDRRTIDSRMERRRVQDLRKVRSDNEMLLSNIKAGLWSLEATSASTTAALANLRDDFQKLQSTFGTLDVESVRTQGSSSSLSTDDSGEHHDRPLSPEAVTPSDSTSPYPRDSYDEFVRPWSARSSSSAIESATHLSDTSASRRRPYSASSSSAMNSRVDMTPNSLSDDSPAQQKIPAKTTHHHTLPDSIQTLHDKTTTGSFLSVSSAKPESRIHSNSLLHSENINHTAEGSTKSSVVVVPLKSADSHSARVPPSLPKRAQRSPPISSVHHNKISELESQSVATPAPHHDPKDVSPSISIRLEDSNKRELPSTDRKTHNRESVRSPGGPITPTAFESTLAGGWMSPSLPSALFTPTGHLMADSPFDHVPPTDSNTAGSPTLDTRQSEPGGPSTTQNQFSETLEGEKGAGLHDREKSDPQAGDDEQQQSPNEKTNASSDTYFTKMDSSASSPASGPPEKLELPPAHSLSAHHSPRLNNHVKRQSSFRISTTSIPTSHGSIEEIVPWEVESEMDGETRKRDDILPWEAESAPEPKDGRSSRFRTLSRTSSQSQSTVSLSGSRESLKPAKSADRLSTVLFRSSSVRQSLAGGDNTIKSTRSIDKLFTTESLSRATSQKKLSQDQQQQQQQQQQQPSLSRTSTQSKPAKLLEKLSLDSLSRNPSQIKPSKSNEKISNNLHRDTPPPSQMKLSRSIEKFSSLSLSRASSLRRANKVVPVVTGPDVQASEQQQTEDQPSAPGGGLLPPFKAYVQRTASTLAKPLQTRLMGSTASVAAPDTAAYTSTASLAATATTGDTAFDIIKRELLSFVEETGCMAVSQLHSKIYPSNSVLKKMWRGFKPRPLPPDIYGDQKARMKQLSRFTVLALKNLWPRATPDYPWKQSHRICCLPTCINYASGYEQENPQE